MLKEHISLEPSPNYPERVVIISTCKCGNTQKVHCMRDDYRGWIEGALIEDVFPRLWPAQRELLITGICTECWEGLFADEEPDSKKKFPEELLDPDAKRTDL